MEEKAKTTFGAKAYKQPKGQWSFGWGLSHGFGETYIWFNVFRVSAYIGIIHVYED